jgi:hypothetical protein
MKQWFHVAEAKRINKADRLKTADKFILSQQLYQCYIAKGQKINSISSP